VNDVAVHIDQDVIVVTVLDVEVVLDQRVPG
jgi:hypothetical protein